MVTQQSTYTLIDDLVAELQKHEPLSRQKANTVTTAIGATITAVVTIGTYFLESGLDMPTWLPFIVMVVGLIGTALGVSQTKNGMTDSVADQLQLGLVERIDLNHEHESEDVSVSNLELSQRVSELQDRAEAILDDHR